MFKLIATDLDGTLLTDERKITQYTKDILKQAVDKGVDFVICTGRMYDSLKYILPELPFCRYAITCMGAEIYDNFEKKCIYEKSIPEEYAQIMARYALAKNIHMNIYIDNILYTNSLDKYSLRYFEETTSMATQIEGDVLEFIKGKKISKLIYIGEPEDMEISGREITDLLCGKVNICASNKRYVEMSAIDAQKDITLNLLAEKLNVERKEMIVFGDSGNDMAMLKNTGFSVCVGNGWPEAKSVSNIIVESNNDDGVAKTVKRLIL